MSRTYAICRLLEHGPLTWRELREITGWPQGSFKSVISRVLRYGMVLRQAIPGTSHYVYALA